MVFKFNVFSLISFSCNFLSVMLVMNFDISRSSGWISINSQSFSSDTSFRQLSSGVSFSSCFAQKKSSRLW